MAGRAARLAWTAGFLSASILCFEIGLMRIMLVGGWHHFAFAVISLALLGFAASGTALGLARGRISGAEDRWLLGISAAAALSMPLCVRLAQMVPLQARAAPSMWAGQAAAWAAAWAILFIPFFLGASAVGLSLMLAGRDVPKVYAGNLLGSGAGSMGAYLAMRPLPPEWLPIAAGAVSLGALFVGGRVGRRVALAAAAAVAAWISLDRPAIRTDPYKYRSYVARLERQGVARRLASARGPQGVVEVFRSDSFHDVPFLSPAAPPPPPVDALLVDGHLVGSAMRVRGPEEAAAVDHALVAAPYDLLPARPRVLLLGEAGGQNVWLALRKGAASVVAVQPRVDLVRILTGPLAEEWGGILSRPGVRVAVEHPRAFVERGGEKFDLIQLVALERLTAGGMGLGGLAEDHLATVEGLSSCLDLLLPEGVVSVCREVETPPRDNLKLLATFVEALRRRGVGEPSRHVAVVRDYLGVCTMVRGTPWGARDVERIRRLCAERQLTPVWFPGVRPDELNRPDALPGPPGGPGDWYARLAEDLFAAGAQRLAAGYIFDVRPPTDDRPFFEDFCRLRSLPLLRAAFGDMWPARAELSFVFVLGAAALASAGGAVLVLLPLALWGRRGAWAPGGWAAVAYFAAIGLGYLMIEVTWLSRFTRMVGDPVLAAAVTFASFLVFSGLGGLLADRLGGVGERAAPLAAAGAALVALVELAALGSIGRLVAGWPQGWRCAAAVIVSAPPAFAMGFPMAMGLRRLDRAAAGLVPWAWGVNGFASVLAAPLAQAAGMAWGFSFAAGAAAVCYAAAAALFARLPGRVSNSGD